MCRNFTTRVSLSSHYLTPAHKSTTPRPQHERAWHACIVHRAQRATQEGGKGPNRASKGGRNGGFWQVLGWAGLASRDNFGAMFQVPEDKAHLRRESNSRHVSESGPHAPGPMYLQGSLNVSEVPRGPSWCTCHRTAYFAVPQRPVPHHLLSWGPLALSLALNTVGIRSVRAPFYVVGNAHRSQLGTSPP